MNLKFQGNGTKGGRSRQVRRSSKTRPGFPIQGHRLPGRIGVFGKRHTFRRASSVMILAMFRLSCEQQVAELDLSPEKREQGSGILTSIPLCCRPSNTGKPSAFNWAGIFIERRVVECAFCGRHQLFEFEAMTDIHPRLISIE